MITHNNLPANLLDRWKELYSEKDFNQLLNALSQNQLPSFRTNSLKITSKDLEKNLTKQEFVFKNVDWYSDAFIFKKQID